MSAAKRDRKSKHGSRLRFSLLATDGDGTLLDDGQLSDQTAKALESFNAVGGKIVLVTGERTREVKQFPRLDLFRYVVAENGGLLFQPRTKKIKVLGPSVPRKLVRALKKRKVSGLKIGKVIVSAKAS